MNNLKIIKLHDILFFIGWTLIMFLGADFPPPIGFIWVILMIGILDFIQHKYLISFLPRLRHKEKWLFIKNLFFFMFGGLVISLVSLLTDISLMMEMGFINITIWVIVITCVTSIYSIFFWFFNKYLISRE
ncbi:hypothetical protein EZV73_24910 [Acidaminobacter sp. JC074]|uniref:hypothetical protein n=1 Tax=Acidaminobacter sp. JC074 TaxID=2530199 RepID=UPI001F0DB066|nr:hypothetical protein [Acidaminobacter sp. JC074]MCH4890844.1 hypothetical protein [Acidaminobacter sp. JC074]